MTPVLEGVGQHDLPVAGQGNVTLAIGFVRDGHPAYFGVVPKGNRDHHPE